MDNFFDKQPVLPEPAEIVPVAPIPQPIPPPTAPRPMPSTRYLEGLRNESGHYRSPAEQAALLGRRPATEVVQTPVSLAEASTQAMLNSATVGVLGRLARMKQLQKDAAERRAQAALLGETLHLPTLATVEAAAARPQTLDDIPTALAAAVLGPTVETTLTSEDNNPDTAAPPVIVPLYQQVRPGARADMRATHDANGQPTKPLSDAEARAAGMLHPAILTDEEAEKFYAPLQAVVERLRALSPEAPDDVYAKVRTEVTPDPARVKEIGQQAALEEAMQLAALDAEERTDLPLPQRKS